MIQKDLELLSLMMTIMLFKLKKNLKNQNLILQLLDYIFIPMMFIEYAKSLRPSDRGELEITDLKQYLY